MLDSFGKRNFAPTGNQVPVLNFQEYISADGETLLTDSRKVAAVFGKRHDDVIRKIRKLNLDLPTDFSLRNFTECFVTNELANGKQEPMFRMTRDGYSLLVMGFTGKKALGFKEAYINAFNEMAKLQHNIRYGLMFEANRKHLEYKGKKGKASECGQRKRQEPRRIAAPECNDYQWRGNISFPLRASPA